MQLPTTCHVVYATPAEDDDRGRRATFRRAVARSEAEAYKYSGGLTVADVRVPPSTRRGTAEVEDAGDIAPAAAGGGGAEDSSITPGVVESIDGNGDASGACAGAPPPAGDVTPSAAALAVLSDDPIAAVPHPDAAVAEPAVTISTPSGAASDSLPSTSVAPQPPTVSDGCPSLQIAAPSATDATVPPPAISPTSTLHDAAAQGVGRWTAKLDAQLAQVLHRTRYDFDKTARVLQLFLQRCLAPEGASTTNDASWITPVECRKRWTDLSFLRSDRDAGIVTAARIPAAAPPVPRPPRSRMPVLSSLPSAVRGKPAKSLCAVQEMTMCVISGGGCGAAVLCVISGGRG